MGSRLGVPSRSRRSKQPSSSELSQQLRPPQFAFDAETQHPHHLYAGPSTSTRTIMASTSAASAPAALRRANQPPPLPSVPIPSSTMRRDLVRRLSSVRSFESLESPTNSSFRRFAAASGGSTASSTTADGPAERAHRKREAEKILDEIANEYAAKRAAGLVPSVPKPARTLLWEELARTERSRVGRRGQCVYGRDSDRGICGCTSYKKKKFARGQVNAGGVCECCSHGGAWHRLAGGAMTHRTSQGYTRSYAGSSVRASRVGSVRCSDAPSRASEYGEVDDDEYDDDEYDDEYDEYDDDEDDDDDDIALEVARPYNDTQNHQVPMTYHPNGYTGPLHSNQLYQNQYQLYQQQQNQMTPAPRDSEVFDVTESLERDGDSMFSNSSSSLGLPSGAKRLDALLRAIQRYRQAGYSEDEIDARIAADFPPAPRRNSQQQRESVVSGDFATM